MPKRRAVPAAPLKGNANDKAKKTAKGFKFPEHLPSGFIIKDTQKKDWQIHETIGVGGFGEVYSACPAEQASAKNATYLNAIKVEPKENGPLYVEMHFNMRVAKESDIEEWKKKKGLKNFGMPVFLGSGSFEYKSNNYRFLVTNRLGRNLQAIFEENGCVFPAVTVLQIGVQVLNILEYIHSKGYIHGDIKASNLMLGMKKENENTVYIIDFGLAAKCTVTDKEFSRDPRKVNNGTLEYISRDGHNGVFGFRGDLEILGFNLIHWVNGSLPWQKYLPDAKAVEQEKIELMKNPSKYIKTHLPKVPAEIIEYLEYMKSLKNNDVPDYNRCRNLFLTKLTEMKCTNPYSKLSFTENTQVNGKSLDETKGGKGRKKLVDAASQQDEPVKAKPTPVKRKASAKNTADMNTDENKDEPLSGKKNRRKVKTDEEKEPEESVITGSTSPINGVSNSEEKKWKAKVSSRVTANKNTRPKRTQLPSPKEDKNEQKNITERTVLKRTAAKKAMAAITEECELKDAISSNSKGKKK